MFTYYQSGVGEELLSDELGHLGLDIATVLHKLLNTEVNFTHHSPSVKQQLSFTFHQIELYYNDRLEDALTTISPDIFSYLYNNTCIIN